MRVVRLLGEGWRGEGGVRVVRLVDGASRRHPGGHLGGGKGSFTLVTGLDYRT